MMLSCDVENIARDKSRYSEMQPLRGKCSDLIILGMSS
jgi:hypothetical protein